MTPARSHHTGRRVLKLNSAFLAGCILFGAVTFNALLALVNANVMRLGSFHVVMAEVALVSAALFLAFLYRSKAMVPWLILLWLIIAIELLIGLGNQEFSPKHLRDVLLIPVFIMLGTVFSYASQAEKHRSLIRLFVLIQSVILVFMIFEGISPRDFGNIFNISSYYANTRGIGANVWHDEATLFISAVRPNDRFLLDGLGIHRLSSIFLEPVSLGNYCIVATILTLSFWRSMSARAKIFFVLTTIALLIGSDGRLATVVCGLLIAGFFIFPYLPRYSNVLYLPVTILAAWTLVAVFDFVGGDDFSGRLTRTTNLLRSLDVASLFGLQIDRAPEFLDSGISYLLVTQSIFGATLIWLFISMTLNQRYRMNVIFVHSICVYISLNLLISYSIFSIKTASLLWFVYGYIYALGLAPVPAAQPQPERRTPAWQSRHA